MNNLSVLLVEDNVDDEYLDLSKPLQENDVVKLGLF